MGFLSNSLKKVVELGTKKCEEDDEDNYLAIMLVAAAIAAGILEVVEDGVSTFIKKM